MSVPCILYILHLKPQKTTHSGCYGFSLFFFHSGYLLRQCVRRFCMSVTETEKVHQRKRVVHDMRALSFFVLNLPAVSFSKQDKCLNTSAFK